MPAFSAGVPSPMLSTITPYEASVPEIPIVSSEAGVFSSEFNSVKEAFKSFIGVTMPISED